MKFLLFQNADPKHFVKRPMKAASPKPPCLGSGMQVKKGESLKVISMVRIGDGKIMMQKGRELVMKVFPALKASYSLISK